MGDEGNDLAGALKSGRAGWWVMGLLAGVSFATVAVIFLWAQFASADDFKRHVESSDKVHVDHETRIRTGEIDRAEMKAMLKAFHEDMYWQLEQEKANARRIGADVVVPEEHKHAR